jgi:hypothetical protein
MPLLTCRSWQVLIIEYDTSNEELQLSDELKELDEKLELELIELEELEELEDAVEQLALKVILKSYEDELTLMVGVLPAVGATVGIAVETAPKDPVPAGASVTWTVMSLVPVNPDFFVKVTSALSAFPVVGV